MPAVLTHKSIMLLARERVEQVRSLLQDKIDAGANVSTVDRQLLAIATETARIMTSDPRPDTELPGIVFANQVGSDDTSYPISQFAVMGSMGPDITAFSGILSPGQAWLFDTVHKGTPDGDRELVNAQTCDFILEFYEQARDKISQDIPAGKPRDKQLDKMRAYALGHLCHVAADVVSHPYVNDVQWQLAPHDISKFHHETEGEMDAVVARTLLRRESTRSGQDWDHWWPEFDAVPDQFFAAYEEALHEVYGVRSRLRKGYRAFATHLEDLGPPSMDVDFIKDGYYFYRHGVMSIGYGYGYWSWWGWLATLIVPALALPLTVAGMPHGSKIFLDAEKERTERGWMEFLTTPLVFGLPSAMSFGILVGTLTTRGVAGRYWLGMGGLILSAVLAIVFFATLGVDELPPEFSWTVLFVIPLALGAVQAFLALIACLRGDRKGRMGLALIFTLPVALLALFFVFFGIVPGVVAPDESATSAFESEGFWIAFAIWAIGMLVAWFTLPLVLRDARIPESPAGGIVGQRFVRLFDDNTLHRDANLAGEDIPDEVYPSGRRELLKLWWTGTGDLFVRSDRYQLVFSASADGSDPQIVPAPIAPMTIAQFIEYLSQNVRQPGGAAVNVLQGAAIHAVDPDGDPDYQLPPGATFSDHGDGEDSPEAHDAMAGEFHKLGTSEEDTDYILYHAPKPAQSVRFGMRGPVGAIRNLGGDVAEPDVEIDGYEYIHDPTDASHSDALMSIASDFAAVLCLGATPHLNDGLQDVGGNAVQKVFQVFRNWNLDRRRVNEWRAIVSGGAINEKGTNRGGYDERMLAHQGPDPTTYRSRLLGTAASPTPAQEAAFQEGESTARRLGLVRLLREWVHLTSTSGQNPLDTAPLRPRNPSNQALNRAMAYVFDLADPTVPPAAP